MEKKQLWQDDRPTSELLILESFPKADEPANPRLEARFETLQRLVTRVRNVRANARLAESTRLKVFVKPLETDLDHLLSATESVLCRVAHLDAIDIVTDKPTGVVTSVDPSFELFVDLGSHVDLDAEVARIDKETTGVSKKLESVMKKLMNTEFLNNAPDAVVQKEKAKAAELKEMLDKLEALRSEYDSGTAGRGA